MTCDMVQFLHDFGYTANDAELRVFLQLSKHHLHNLFLDQLIDLGVRVNDMPVNQLTSSLRAGLQVHYATNYVKLKHVYLLVFALCVE